MLWAGKGVEGAQLDGASPRAFAYLGADEVQIEGRGCAETALIVEGQKRAEKLAPKMAEKLAPKMAEKLAEELAKNKQFENAKNLLKMNVLSVEQISEALGLSLEDVNKIKQEI